jgi:hypothetical protein
MNHAASSPSEASIKCKCNHFLSEKKGLHGKTVQWILFFWKFGSREYMRFLPLSLEHGKESGEAVSISHGK